MNACYFLGYYQSWRFSCLFDSEPITGSRIGLRRASTGEPTLEVCVESGACHPHLGAWELHLQVGDSSGCPCSVEHLARTLATPCMTAQLSETSQDASHTLQDCAQLSETSQDASHTLQDCAQLERQETPCGEAGMLHGFRLDLKTMATKTVY
ncbi:hypothetical protein ElyMa_004343100 [Elysia marginata]|uniref:Uncharacterized protein n=1 Tax=Elysia marginata TaxID=1093978 RepID=A0AAV4H339_9GAST|nr:hypothetical protein ElyMa_004343100 [Elysia marginata]